MKSILMVVLIMFNSVVLARSAYLGDRFSCISNDNEEVSFALTRQINRITNDSGIYSLSISYKGSLQRFRVRGGLTHLSNGFMESYSTFDQSSELKVSISFKDDFIQESVSILINNNFYSCK